MFGSDRWAAGWNHLDNSVVGTGASQTRALHRSLLSAHRCQNGRGGEQRLSHTWTHSHQPKQVHCVRPQPHGENHFWEAQRRPQRGDGPDLSSPLPLGRRLPVFWKVSGLFFLLLFMVFFFILWWLQFPWSWLNRFFMRSVTSGSQWGSLYILREEIPSIGRLEVQLKACLCRLVFSKAKVRIVSRWQFVSIAASAVSLSNANAIYCFFGFFPVSRSRQC